MSLDKFNSARDPSDHISEAAHQAHKSSARSQAQNVPGSLLPVLNANDGNARGQVISQNELLRGNWIGRTARDMAEDDKWEMFARAPTALGDKQLPFQEYTDYIARKRERQEFQNLLVLGSQLIDPKRPETQANAYAVMSQLKTVTDEDFRRELQTQIYLRHIVMNGHISTYEELQFIHHMLHPDFVLPSNPLWDLTGAIAGDNATAQTPRDQGLFMHYLWASTDKLLTDIAKHPGLAEPQIKMKAKIVHRCLPALRDLTFEQAADFCRAYALNVLVSPGPTYEFKNVNNMHPFPFAGTYNAGAVGGRNSDSGKVPMNQFLR